MVRVRKVIPMEVGAPESMVAPAGAFRVATRRIINKGAMTLKQPASDYGVTNGINKNTYLNLSQDWQEDIRSAVAGGVRPDE